VENGVLRWAPYDAPCLCLYIGGVDRFYSGSLEEALREELCAHPAYLASESGVPAEDALFFGYHSPRAGTFYLAREMLPAVALVVHETTRKRRDGTLSLAESSDDNIQQEGRPCPKPKS
ncbi:MAG: hypothetical protein IH608_01110, partial [Proteobacteria bacterium]|nr:hypothetical protein [Pseudomonadota bacterium]